MPHTESQGDRLRSKYYNKIKSTMQDSRNQEMEALLENEDDEDVSGDDDVERGDRAARLARSVRSS